MVDTVNVSRQMERNKQLGNKDFYLVQLPTGEVEFCGSLPLEKVAELIKEKVVQEGTYDTSRWIPTSPLPSLPAPMDQVLKKPGLVKSAAGDLMTWLLSFQGKQKPGDEGFLGWSFPVNRALFVKNDKALSAMKEPFFSLENIVPWKRLAALKNGFQAGDKTLLLPSSGVKAWLSFLRIFIEVSFQIRSWTKIEFSCCSGVQ